MKKFFISIFALFSEDGSRCSLGRISFWISFIIAIHIWVNKPYNEFPESLLWFLFFGYVYNTSKKLLHVILPAFLAKKIPGLGNQSIIQGSEDLRFRDEPRTNKQTDTTPIQDEPEELKRVEK